MGFLSNSFTKKVAVLQSIYNLYYRSSFFIQCCHLMSWNYNTVSSIYQIRTPGRTLWKNKRWASVTQKADPIFYEEIDRQNLKRKRWNKDKLIQLVTSRSFRYKRKVKKEFPIKVSCWHWSRHISWARCTHSFTQDEYIRTFSALRWCRT